MESNILFYKDENGKTEYKLIKDFSDLNHILFELGISNSDLLLSDGIIFVEGPTDVKVYKKLFDAYCKMKNQYYNVAILHLGGGDNIRHCLDGQFLSELKKNQP